MAASYWLTTVDCAECIKRVVGHDCAIGSWYIRDAIRETDPSTRLIARRRHETHAYRKRAKFRIHPDDFADYVRRTHPAIAAAVIADMRQMIARAA